MESEPGKAVLSNLKAKLAALGLVGAAAFEVKRGPKTEVQARFHPREFMTTDGWKVLVGRNDLENDHLTFKVASREDMWFHARQAHGSHVVLKRPSQKSQPSKRSIEEAASLAAYFSKQRTSRKVSVSYTLVKHLRKPKKAKAGLVFVQQEKSILVEPQPLSPAEPSETTDDQPEQLTHR